MQCSKEDSSVPDTPPMHETVSQRNMVFWDELCGTALAKSIGVTDSSPESLKKFDDWYLAYYPYLFDHIPFESMRGRHVLEVGLGYGTVSQRLAEAGARYEGLDIARNPVAMVNHRLRQAGLPGQAQQGSILAAPFPNETFDFVVAIGLPASRRRHAKGDRRVQARAPHRRRVCVYGLLCVFLPALLSIHLRNAWLPA